MGDGPQRVDYLQEEEFRKRAHEHIARGDKPVGETRMLVVTFDADFDKFAANVAYELRHLVVYRSDGGHFARGLVRQTGQLAGFHRELLKLPTATGTKVTLAARLYRRSNPDPTLRWMMSIQFGRPVIQGDAEVIHASPEITHQSDKNFGDTMLHQIAIVVENPLWKGDRQKRLRDWVKLAEQAGYPGYQDLWYYNRVAVFEYVNWNTTDPRRLEMTAKTGGAVPFDGFTGAMSRGKSFSAPPNTPWRNYPFRNAIAKCKGQPSIDRCSGLIGAELKFAESEIFESIGEMNKQLNRAAPAQSAFGILTPPTTGASSQVTGALATKFFKHISDLLNDPKSLYATYMKYSQSGSGLWGDF